MMDDMAQERETVLAYEQNRQPNCVYCRHPLDEVRQDQDEVISWTYDKILKQYEKSEGGEADTPYHECSECNDSCQAADWAFIDYKLINF